jgi:myo-inositol-1(or 4)-monophosphatase
MADYSTELNIARTAADSAAEIIQEYQRDNSFTVDFKAKNDLITEADLKAEEEILSIIKKEFPNDEILAEESAQKDTLPGGRVWLIDPIDGTTNFAHGFPVYCVSIALWDDKEPKMGLVLEVSSEEYFTAIAGKGAFLNGKLISVSKLQNPKHSLIGTGFPYKDLSLVDNYLNYFRFLMHNTHGVRRAGSAAYDLCFLACGRFDGFYEYALNPWDVGAGVLIIKEAGGTVSDWSGGTDWLFGKRIVAGNPTMHKFLLDGIQEHFTEEEIKAKMREV